MTTEIEARPTDDSGGYRPVPGVRRIAALILALYASAVVATAYRLAATADEGRHLAAAHTIVRTGSWDFPDLRVQGPLGLYFNQLWVGDVSAEEYRRGVSQSVLFRGRLGLLPFAVLAGALIFRWSRRVFGDVGGLLSLAAFCLHPVMIGYAALVNVDMAHAAMTLVTAYMLWRFCQTGTRPRVVCVGIALGLTIATKYLALPLLPCVVIVIFVTACRRKLQDSPLGRSLLHGLEMTALMTVAMVVALHAAYLFRGGFAPQGSEHYESELLGRISELPGLKALLSLLPEAFCLGADWLLAFDTSERTTYLLGAFRDNPWSYYVWVFLLKTPDVILVLLAATVAVGAKRLLRPGTPRSASTTLLITVFLVAVPLTYLSVFASFKVGIRYSLQYYPLLFVALGVLGPVLGRYVQDRRWLAAVGIVMGLILANESWRTWPNLIAYYNWGAGGQIRGYEYFNDSNSEWRQYSVEGLEVLRAASSEPFEILRGGDSPRFGRVAAHIDDLTLPDRTDPTRAWHWLHAFEPERSAGAAWWLFDISPEAFERAVENGDDRLREGLVLAYLTANRQDDAENHLSQLDSERAQIWHELSASLGQDTSTRPEEALQLAGRFLAHGHAEVACTILQREGLADSPERTSVLAMALLVRRRLDEAIDLLEADEQRAPSARNVMTLMTLYLKHFRYAEGQDLYERHRTLLETEQPEWARTLAERLSYVRAAFELIGVDEP